MMTRQQWLRTHDHGLRSIHCSLNLGGVLMAQENQQWQAGPRISFTGPWVEGSTWVFVTERAGLVQCWSAMNPKMIDVHVHRDISRMWWNCVYAFYCWSWRTHGRFCFEQVSTLVCLNVIMGLCVVSIGGWLAVCIASIPVLVPHIGFLLFMAISLWVLINWWGKGRLPTLWYMQGVMMHWIWEFDGGTF